jgi:hypothetical protein
MQTASNPVTLESLGLSNWSELYGMSSREIVGKLGKGPVHPGDAFLAVMVLRAVDDLGRASRRLEWLTCALVALTVALVALALATA